MDKSAFLEQLDELENGILDVSANNKALSVKSGQMINLVKPEDLQKAMDSLIYLSGSIMRVQSNIDALKRMINAHDKSEAA